MNPAVRALAPAAVRLRPAPAPAVASRWTQVSRRLLVAAVLVNMVISGNLLLRWGLDYASPGGNPLVKFHPGTYLAVLGFALMLWERNEPLVTLRAWWQRDREVMLYLASLLLCVLFALNANGPSGTAVYIENFAPAGILALVLGHAPSAILRRLGYLMLALFALSVVLALGENVLQQRLIPMNMDVSHLELNTEFRGTGLWDHPLTGAAMTMIAVFLLLATHIPPLWRATLGLVFLAGLIAFGGRTALGLTLLTLAAYGAVWMVRGLLWRRLRARHVVLLLLALVAIPLFIWFVAAQADVGERLLGHLYWDESAQSRAAQWRVFVELTPGELLFGTSFERLTQVTFNIGLTVPFAIESFWLVILVNIGIFGFIVFMAGLLAFSHHLWKVSSTAGRVILTLTLLIATTSNSLGRKSNLLTIGVAAILAANAFRASRAAAASQPAAIPPRRCDSVFAPAGSQDRVLRPQPHVRRQ